MVFDDNRFKIGKVPAEGNTKPLRREGAGTFGANAVHAEDAEKIRAMDAENFSADRVKEFRENLRCIQSV